MFIFTSEVHQTTYLTLARIQFIMTFFSTCIHALKMHESRNFSLRIVLGTKLKIV